MLKIKKLLSTLLAASKKAITHKWLQQQPALIDSWIDIIYDIYEMETLTSYLKLRQDLFYHFLWQTGLTTSMSKRVEDDFVSTVYGFSGLYI